jgi:hypothetical protein
MKNKTVQAAIAIVTVGCLSFYGGMKYQQTKRPSFTNSFANGQQGRNDGRNMTGAGQQFQGNGNRGDMMGFRPVSGEIISADKNSVTVKLDDGSSKIIIISDTTTINKASQATKDELVTGEKIAVFGQQNSDGSVTANTIQMNPIQTPVISQPVK